MNYSDTSDSPSTDCLTSAKSKKRTFHIYLDRDIAEMFERLYPHCRSRFIENAMKLANNSQVSFDKIMFSSVL